MSSTGGYRVAAAKPARATDAKKKAAKMVKKRVETPSVPKTPNSGKLTDKRLEELIYIIMELSRQVKDCCKAFTIQALHSGDAEHFARCIRSCMEMMEVSDLVLFILSNSSPNTKAGLEFAIKVVDTTESECVKHQDDEYCKNSCALCTGSFKKYRVALKELLAGI